ncbi:MAG: hypothetical protein ACP5EN_01260, partial [Rhodovulum sp.]
GSHNVAQTQFGDPPMSDDKYDVIVPASASKWIGLIGGLLVPIFFGVVGAQLYGGGSSNQTVQVYPLPEE